MIPQVKWQAFLAWGLGIAANYLSFGIGQVNSILVAFLIEAGLSLWIEKIRNVKNTKIVSENV